MIADLTKFLKEAIKQVPSVRYAFGAAGIAAAGALITLFLGYGRSAVIVWAGTFIAMVLLLVFASVATSGNRDLRKPGLILVYVVTFCFCLFLLFTVTAFSLSWPPNWAKFLGIDLSGDIRSFSVLGDLVRFGCERGANSNASFSPPPGFRIINAHADTVEVDGAKSASAVVTARQDHTATARGDFFGRDLEWTRNCPGGGQGRVRLSGDYVHEDPPPFVYISAASVFALGAALAAFALYPQRPRSRRSRRNR
jgi:hypothetical protein